MTITGRGDETTPAVDAAASWRARVDVTVRTLEPRPAWARCGVCDPEGAC